MGQLVPITRKTNLNIAICPKAMTECVDANTLASMSRAVEEFDEFPDLFLDSFETLSDLFDQVNLSILKLLKDGPEPLSCEYLAEQVGMDAFDVEEKLVSLFRVGVIQSIQRGGKSYYYTYFEQIKIIGTLRIDA